MKELKYFFTTSNIHSCMIIEKKIKNETTVYMQKHDVRADS